MTPDQQSAFQTLHDMHGRRLYHFIGGVDRSKRIDFLLDVARAAHARDPAFALIVGGQGEDVGLLREHNDYVRHIPHVDEATHATIATLSNGCIMPGRVGLIAIDCQALGVPLYTTRHPFHAPEVEYLTAGEELHYLPNEPVSFAADLFDVRRVRQFPVEPVMTVERVATSFVRACLAVETTAEA